MKNTFCSNPSDRVKLEKDYWQMAASDPDLDNKYISDISDSECFRALNKYGELKSKVLDLGCGVGRLMKPNYFGVDISPLMIEIAKKRKPDCTFLECDGRSIPFASRFFRSVYSVLVFQHLPIEAIECYINEVNRVLKTGGGFVFQFIDGDENEPFSIHHRADDVMKILKSNNFINIISENGLGHRMWTWVYTEKS